MMSHRRVALLAVVVALAGIAGPTYAGKPKSSCLMLTDPAGDAKLAAQGSSYDADDILSADIATGKRSLVAVLRLKSGDAADGLATGDTYTLSWHQRSGSVSTTPVLTLYVYTTGSVAGTFTSDKSDPNATTWDVPASLGRDGLVTWTVSRKIAGLRPGATISQLAASSQLAMNYSGDAAGSTDLRTNIAQPMDVASGAKSYVDQQPSCVRAS